MVEEFNSHKDSDCVRITAAGGEVLDARWVQREEPYATLVTARLPTASTLENVGTIKDEKGEVPAQPASRRTATGEDSSATDRN